MTFAQLDLLPSDLILNAIFTFDDDRDTPFNNQFELMGYSSSNALKNLGSTAIYMTMNLFLLCIICILSIFDHPKLL